ncbi:hypothetical protein F5Y17DRAFT_443655, partial [Xylariaceae sp. FL0594]
MNAGRKGRRPRKTITFRKVNKPLPSPKPEASNEDEAKPVSANMPPNSLNLFRTTVVKIEASTDNAMAGQKPGNKEEIPDKQTIEEMIRSGSPNETKDSKNQLLVFRTIAPTETATPPPPPARISPDASPRTRPRRLGLLGSRKSLWREDSNSKSKRPIQFRSRLIPSSEPKLGPKSKRNPGFRVAKRMGRSPGGQLPRIDLAAMVRKVVGEPPVHFRSVSFQSATPDHIQSYSPAIITDDTNTSVTEDGLEGVHHAVQPTDHLRIVESPGTLANVESVQEPDIPESAEKTECMGSSKDNKTGGIESTASLEDNGANRNTEIYETAARIGKPENTAQMEKSERTAPTEPMGRITGFDDLARLLERNSLGSTPQRKARAAPERIRERLEAPNPNEESLQAAVEPLSQKLTTPPRRRSQSPSSGGHGSPPKAPSQKIDVVGFTPHAKFLTHALAVSGHRPTGIYVHSKHPLTQWGLEDRQITVYNQALVPVSSAPVPYPTYIFDRRRYSGGPNDKGFFDNLIVDMSAASGISFFKELKPRIDRWTTICLLHPGLGEMEMLNQKVFRDTASRPSFVLGTSTHNIAKMAGKMYSIQHRDRHPARILLHGVVDSMELSPSKMEPRARQQWIQTQNLIKIISSVPNLGVIPVPWYIYLDSKLPKMIFKSLADTISVILGLQYRHIAPNAPAMRLWDNLLDEILMVIEKFPELQTKGSPRLVYERLAGPTFRKTLLQYLACQEPNVSHWVSWVRYGGAVPIDYFNGYFVKRAKELGLQTPYNDMAIDAVKSRIAQRRLELDADIPQAYSPYMTDHDLISDGEPVNAIDANLLKGM